MRRLVIRPGGIGDIILAMPAIAHLCPTEVWTRAEMLPFFPNAKSIAASGIDSLGYFGTPDLSNFDEIHTWYGAQRDDFRTALDALHAKVFWYEALPKDSNQHAADFFATQVQAPTPATPRIDVAPQPNRLIWIHPFSGGSKKNWPLDNYHQLAAYLRATGRSVQFFAAPHQAGIVPGARIVEDLKELASLLSGGQLYIGNDSGITHLAAASGAPTIAIFLNTDPRVWGPRGHIVEVLDNPTVDQVLHAALAQLGFE
jgi:heptosyltransferase III